MNSQIQQRFPARLDHRRPLGGAHAADGIRDIVLCLHHPGISLHLIITRQGSEGLAARLPIEGRTAPICPNCPGRRGATLRAPLLSVIAWPSFLPALPSSSREGSGCWTIGLLSPAIVWVLRPQGQPINVRIARGPPGTEEWNVY